MRTNISLRTDISKEINAFIIVNRRLDRVELIQAAESMDGPLKRENKSPERIARHVLCRGDAVRDVEMACRNEADCAEDYLWT